MRASSTSSPCWKRTITGAPIRRLACEATIIPLVLNGAGVPLDIGRGQRLATASQRRALEAAHEGGWTLHLTPDTRHLHATPPEP